MPKFSPKRSYSMNQKIFVHINKSQKLHFFIDNIFRTTFFTTFSTNSKSAFNSAFLKPILNFSNFFVLAHISTFC
jgi:hypothetical protein